jgi:hypothetical protein
LWRRLLPNAVKSSTPLHGVAVGALSFERANAAVSASAPREPLARSGPHTRA